jgi:hypothetical protein
MLVRIRWEPGKYSISIPVDEPGEEQQQRVLLDVEEFAMELTNVYDVKPVVSRSRLALSVHAVEGTDCGKYIVRLVFLVEAHLDASLFLLRATPPTANKFGRFIVTERLWYLPPVTAEIEEALRLQKEVDEIETTGLG